MLCEGFIVNFRGLFKGSTSQLMDSGHRTVPIERPKTLQKLKNVYENVSEEGNNVAAVEDGSNSNRSLISSTDKSLSILSPFDEQEEWAKISEIMASFSSGLVRDSVFVAEMEKEIQSRLGLSSQIKEDTPKVVSEIGQWLLTINLGHHEHNFLENGYDDLDFFNGILEKNELKFLGLSDDEVSLFLEEQKNLPNKICEVQKQYPSNNYSNSNNNNNNSLIKSNSEFEKDIDDANDDEESGGNERQAEKESDLVDKWLDSIHLGIYKEAFKRHSYLDMDRIRRIWEIELSSVLDITKRGHRRRILTSANSSFNGETDCGPNLEEITADLSQLKSNIQQLKEEIREKMPAPANSQIATVTPNSVSNLTSPGTGILRHSHKKNKPAPPPPIALPEAATPAKSILAPHLPIRNPSELLVGVPLTLTTQWRHRPEELVSGSITYVANYLGSTVVKELKGTESTKKSIQKLKKTSKELTTTPDIMLAISYKGVKFLNTGTQELVCEHEIRNIHCACQDADDLTHFAYITKDHISRSHYCHVFCVDTMDQATEVILTLGQAFEVAYQITLREQFSGNRRSNGHSRSQSANQIVSNTLWVNNQNNHSQVPNHSRSLSVNEIKLNDGPKTMTDQSNPAGIIKLEECEKAPLVANEDL